MPRSRRRFSREFKLDAVRMALSSDRPTTAVAGELGITPEMLRRWKKQYADDPDQSFPGNGRLKDRDRETDALRREVAQLKAENAFLKKVSGYFARGQK